VRLRTRFALVMALGAVVPLVGAGALARVVLVDRFAQISARRSEAAIQRVSRALTARVESQQRLLDRFCAHDYLVDRTLLQLETGQFTDTAQAELAAVLPEVATRDGLDALSLVRADGLVLASAHYPGQAGSRDPGVYDRAARVAGGRRWVRVRARARDPGPIRPPRAGERLHPPPRRASVAVSGGEVLDDALLRRDRARRRGSRPARARATSAGLGAGAWRASRPLRGFDGAPVASVVLEARDDTLRATSWRPRPLLTALARSSRPSWRAAARGAAGAALAGPIGVVADAPIASPRASATCRSRAHRRRGGGAPGAAFNRMTRELKDADKRVRRAERLAAWRDIARQMAHEIKNPLTPIRMAVEMLRKARASARSPTSTSSSKRRRASCSTRWSGCDVSSRTSRASPARRSRAPRPCRVPEVVAHAWSSSTPATPSP
jgi:two-component system nitrogen regulation sensor histidine kinase NtrY